MNKTTGKNKVMTPEEAEFVKDLLLRNRQTISSVIKMLLKDGYSFLYDDCLSETYLTACQKVDILKVHGNPDAWITVAAKWSTMALLKEFKRQKYLNNQANEFVCSTKDSVFEEVVYNIWVENNVPEKLISELTKREKEVYRLLFLEQKTPQEVANELGISISTVRNTKKHLIDKIKEIIEKIT